MTESEIRFRMTDDGPVCSGEECPAFRHPNPQGSRLHGMCYAGGVHCTVDDVCLNGLRRLLAERTEECGRLKEDVRKEEIATLQLIDERDLREDQVTAIAEALGIEDEWSNLCDLGVEALEKVSETMAELYRLRHEIEHPADAEDPCAECDEACCPGCLQEHVEVSIKRLHGRLVEVKSESASLAHQLAEAQARGDEYRELIGVCPEHGTLNSVVDTNCDECMKEHIQEHRKRMEDLHGRLVAADKALYAPAPAETAADSKEG